MDISSLWSKIEAKLDKSNKELGDLISKAESNLTSHFESKIGEVSNQCNALQTQVQTQSQLIQKLQQDNEILHLMLRQKNVIISGLAGQENDKREKTIEILQEKLKKRGIDLHPSNIDHIYRLGKHKPNKGNRMKNGIVVPTVNGHIKSTHPIYKTEAQAAHHIKVLHTPIWFFYPKLG
ncbi:unnamed protein product, partial [Allacma fusca]